MNRNGPIVIIEDDIDDQEMLEEVFNKLDYSNERIYFANGEEALKFLEAKDRKPFLILSDINLPKLDGFALRQKLKTDAALEIKCIPYIFFTTASNQKAVVQAYSLSAQGFFIKPNSIIELEKVISVIVEYWKLCVSPNAILPEPAEVY